MSDKVAYTPPPVPEPPKQFAAMLIGIVLIVIGALLINQGMNAVQASSALILGVGLLAAGALMVFAGGSRVWPGRPMANISILIVGVILLVASGTQLAVDWGRAAYGIVLTIVGIVLIVVGVQITRQSWKKYVKR
jgi:drug/metabolite transporter (DMT)-like permease